MSDFISTQKQIHIGMVYMIVGQEDLNLRKTISVLSNRYFTSHNIKLRVNTTPAAKYPTRMTSCLNKRSHPQQFQSKASL
jgi:hypothetical protein